MISHALRSLTLSVGIICIGTVPLLAAMPSQAEVRSSRERSLFEGDWETVIGASRLLFRFKLENGTWMGWFVSRKNGQSYSLRDVKVEGRMLSFLYPSKPELRYVVRAQKDNQTLTGTSTSPDGDATPRSLIRMQGQ